MLQEIIKQQDKRWKRYGFLAQQDVQAISLRGNGDALKTFSCETSRYDRLLHTKSFSRKLHKICKLPSSQRFELCQDDEELYRIRLESQSLQKCKASSDYYQIKMKPITFNSTSTFAIPSSPSASILHLSQSKFIQRVLFSHHHMQGNSFTVLFSHRGPFMLSLASEVSRQHNRAIASAGWI